MRPCIKAVGPRKSRAKANSTSFLPCGPASLIETLLSCLKRTTSDIRFWSHKLVVAFLRQITIVINSVDVVLVTLGLGWAYVTLRCPSENTTAFWIMTFPHLWINTESFLYLLVQYLFAIWCLVWLHLHLLKDFRRRLGLHMGRRREHCWFLPYVHLFIYYDFYNLTNVDPFRQTLHCSLGTSFFVCSAGSFLENTFLKMPLPLV